MDENCRNFFNSRITLKHLYKQGFINKKGLLIDPERKNEILGFVQNANGKNKLIKKIKTLSILNMGYKNSSEQKDEKIKKITLNPLNMKNLYRKDFISMNDNNNMRQYRINNRIILPKIRNRTNQNLEKTEETKRK